MRSAQTTSNVHVYCSTQRMTYHCLSEDYSSVAEFGSPCSLLRVLYCCIKFVRYCITFILNSRFFCITTNTQCTRMSTESICFIYEGNIKQ